MLLTLAAAVMALGLPASAGDLAGTVLESRDSGGYTYLLIKTASGEKKWAAVPKSKVKAGDKAVVVNSNDMVDFESPTLKRKFAVIAFGTLGDPAAPAADPHSGAGKSHGARAQVAGPIKVAKAGGPDGRAVGEVYAQKKSLQGKEVVVSGKIVKYNAGILERNWAHLRDGSGNAKDGTDDLTVLLKDESELGRVVTVRGKVVLDKDLGGMYRFAVVLEDAVLVQPPAAR